MRFLIYHTCTCLDPRDPEFKGMDPAGWTIPVEADNHEAAAIKVLGNPEYVWPQPGTFWVHVAEDESWNRHKSGTVMTCRAFKMTTTNPDAEELVPREH